MPLELPGQLRALLADQGRVVARSQAVGTGLEAGAVRNRLRYGDWQRLGHGVYAAFTGDPSREAKIWAALLRAGPGYVACVEIDGMAAHPVDEQWQDKDRDRWNAVHEKIDTIRIGVPQLRNRLARCATASDIATWLSGRGPRTGHPGAANCQVPRSWEAGWGRG